MSKSNKVATSLVVGEKWLQERISSFIEAKYKVKVEEVTEIGKVEGATVYRVDAYENEEDLFKAEGGDIHGNYEL